MPVRKRSSYRPKRNYQDPLNWVLNGMKPLTTLASSIVDTVRTMNHGAIRAIQTGTAEWEDVSTLVVAFKVAIYLAEQTKGLGSDWMNEMNAALAIAEDLELRSSYLLRGGELQVINLAMELHDVQLSSCTTTQMEIALRDVKKFLTKRKEVSRANAQQLQPEPL